MATEPRLTRFQGTVMLSADRPARDMGRIAEAVVEQLTTLPGANISLKPEMDAEVATGLDRDKVGPPMEHAATPGFMDRSIEQVASRGLFWSGAGQGRPGEQAVDHGGTLLGRGLHGVAVPVGRGRDGGTDPKLEIDA